MIGVLEEGKWGREGRRMERTEFIYMKLSCRAGKEVRSAPPDHERRAGTASWTLLEVIK